MTMSTFDQTTSSGGLKARLKARLQSMPRLWNFYWGMKQQIRRLALLRYHLADARNTYRHMFWHQDDNRYRPLAAELIFQFHKIEKGLVMPGNERLFSVEPALTCIRLLKRWIAAELNRDNPVFLGAIETLVAYEIRLTEKHLDPDDLVTSKVRNFLSSVGERDSALSTPHRLASPASSQGFDGESFLSLATLRRSVRSFLPVSVSRAVIEAAVQSAQLSPSACNRQPWHVYVVSDEHKKSRLLRHQNGNRGFGHLAPHIAIITADAQCFFDASERHEPFIDGGLFSMSFILALAAEGVGSCCLNWCVTPETDKAVHEIFDISDAHRIVMLVAFGYPAEDCVVPRSPRRSIKDVLSFIS